MLIAIIGQESEIFLASGSPSSPIAAATRSPVSAPSLLPLLRIFSTNLPDPLI